MSKFVEIECNSGVAHQVSLGWSSFDGGFENAFELFRSEIFLYLHRCAVLHLNNIMRWVDAHSNLPPGQGGLRKQMWLLTEQLSGTSVSPPLIGGLFHWLSDFLNASGRSHIASSSN